MRGAEHKFSEVNQEIAGMLALTEVTQDDLEKCYGADVLEAGRDEIEFMRGLLVLEREELVSRGWDWTTKGPGFILQNQADWISTKMVFAVRMGAWSPTNIEHLKYVLFRAELHGFSEKFAADIHARIHAAEAVQAVSSILRRQG